MRILAQILILLGLSGGVCTAQSYVALSPDASVSSGSIRNILGGSIEVGHQWGKWGLGFDLGKTSFSRIGQADTTTYYEWRPFYTLYEHNGIAQILTLGYGKVLQAVRSNLLEINYGVELPLSRQIDYITFYTGSYLYWGQGGSNLSPFMGITFTKTLKHK